MAVRTSIIIPIKNGEATIRECLESIFTQDYPEGFEVIVIDSGSTDNTLHIVRRFPIRLFEIKAEEFHHAKTRSYGVDLAKGEFVVFLSDDVRPKGRLWLQNITENLKDPQVAGVSGRQMPRDNATPMECHWLSYFYPVKKLSVNLPKGTKVVREDCYYFFSDANSAMRREVLLKHKFPENIIMAEDKAWCRKVLLEGYTIVFEPQAEAYHSHSYTLKRAFQTFFDGGMAYSQFCKHPGETSLQKTAKQAVDYLISEILFLLRKGHIKYIPYALVYDAAKFLGRTLGKNHKHLPRFINMKLCRHKDIYQRLK